MGEKPGLRFMTGVIETRKAWKRLPREDRQTIECADLVEINRLAVDKGATPETIAEAERKYYKDHPELVAPLERLEQLVKG